MNFSVLTPSADKQVFTYEEMIAFTHGINSGVPTVIPRSWVPFGIGHQMPTEIMVSDSLKQSYFPFINNSEWPNNVIIVGPSLVELLLDCTKITEFKLCVIANNPTEFITLVNSSLKCIHDWATGYKTCAITMSLTNEVI